MTETEIPTDGASDASSAAADSEIRGVRRIFLVALAAALLAAATAFAVELAHSSDSTSAAPTVAALPLVFSQPGFVERQVHRVASVQLPANRRHGVLRLPGGDAPLYIVARCDTGRVQATLGALSTAQACSGGAAGVVVLSQVRRPASLQVTVSATQRTPWAVGAYR